MIIGDARCVSLLALRTLKDVILLMFNRHAAIVLALALVAGLGLVTAQKVFVNAPPTPQAASIMFYSAPRDLPAFSLTQADGSTLDAATLQGHWTLIFIGFTSCPDVCPLTLHNLAQAQKQWETLPEASRPRVLFVSIDPQRDVPERLSAYTQAFHRDTLAATTTDELALEQFTTALGLVFMQVPGKGFATNRDDYSMDHSATIAVLNPQAQLAGVMRPPFDASLIAEDFLRLYKMDTAAP